MNRTVPMNYITVTSVRYWRCSPPCNSKNSDSNTLSENITKSTKPLPVEMTCLRRCLATDSRKTCASLFSLLCLISCVETQPQWHCIIFPLFADGRKDKVFTSLCWLRLAIFPFVRRTPPSFTRSLLRAHIFLY